MAAKPDPKDDRIAELELALEAANAATSKAQTEAQQVEALRSEVSKLTDSIKARDSKILTLEGELTAARASNVDQSRATVPGLDPANAIQLKVSCVVTNALNGVRIDAVAGDVLVEKDAFSAVAAKVGTTARVHPVSKEEIDAAKKSGRAH